MDILESVKQTNRYVFWNIVIPVLQDQPKNQDVSLGISKSFPRSSNRSLLPKY